MYRFFEGDFVWGAWKCLTILSVISAMTHSRSKYGVITHNHTKHAGRLLEHILFTVFIRKKLQHALYHYFLLQCDPNSEGWSLNPLKVKQDLLTSVLFLTLIHPRTVTLSFSERKVAPFVSTVTDVFSHLSVSDSAQWVNSNLIPAIRRSFSLWCLRPAVVI